MAKRTRRKVLLAKIEDVPGTLQAPDAATDGIQMEGYKFVKKPQNTDTDEHQPSFDKSPTIVGGIQASMQFKVYLKGSAAPGTAPSWGKLLKACGLQEIVTRQVKTATTLAIAGTGTQITDSGDGLAALTAGTVIYVATPTQFAEVIVTSSAAGELDFDVLSGALVDEVAGGSFSLYYGIVGTTATAGSTTGATLQAPFAATAELYRGMPIVLSTNPVAPAFSAVQDYSAGRIVALPETMGDALDTDTDASVPANVLYVPAGTDPPSLTMYGYEDGILQRLKGALGDVTMTWENGKPAYFQFTFTGIYVDRTDAALPTPVYPDYGVPKPIWKNGKSKIDRALAACSKFEVALNNQLPYPPNPEEAEGFGAAVLVSRGLTGNFNPLTTLVATRDIAAKFKAGTPQAIFAAMAGAPGNRVAALVPQALHTDHADDDDQGLMVETVKFDCQGVNSGLYLAVY